MPNKLCIYFRAKVLQRNLLTVVKGWTGQVDSSCSPVRRQSLADSYSPCDSSTLPRLILAEENKIYGS